MRIVFMGTPEFAVPSLEALIEAGREPEAVVTGPDRPRGRGQEVTPTPVKQVALDAGISPILQPEDVKSDVFAKDVAALDPDVIVVVAYKILPPQVYEQAAMGAFNLHGSLLPKYRGAAPINWAVINGETNTGVTTFFLQEQVDTGNVIVKKEMEIGPDETAGEVHDRMMHLGADAVVETVRRIESGTVETQAQDDAKATPAPKIHTEDCEIPWEKSGEDVHNFIRGLSPYPGAWTTHGSGDDATRLKVYRSARVDAESVSASGAPGEVLAAGDRLVVACGEGAVELTRLQQPGKQRLPAPDFLNGYPLNEGDRLGE
jgi:methionyl-tRNA formyltransferase